MARLKDYVKSPINIITIKYGKETITFNLAEELIITEAKLDKELKEQPSYYGFLLLFHKKLITKFEDLKLSRRRTWGKLTLLGKKKNQEGTSRAYTNDMVEAWVESHKDYIEASRLCIIAKDDADAIYAAVKAFEQRKDLLQTISSNLRKENF